MTKHYALESFFGPGRNEMVSAIPHAHALGMVVEVTGPAFAILRQPYRAELVGDPSRGIVFGGAIATLLDQALGLAVSCGLADLRPIATLDLRIDYQRIAFPLLRGFPLTPVPVHPKVLVAYTGKYQFDDFDVTIRVDGARIYFGVPGSGEAELIAISEDRYYLADLYADITFHRNDHGEVDRMEGVVIGGPLEATKIP